MGRYISQVLVAGAAVISEVEPDGAHANRSSASPYIRLGHSPDHNPACDGHGLQGERDHSFLRHSSSQGTKAVALSSDITRSRSSASAQAGSGLHGHIGWQGAGFDIAPQQDQQLARQGYNRNASDPAGGRTHTAAEPDRERTV